MKKAIYPGSFDPITNGHIDIVKRGMNIFDEVHIAVLNNPKKMCRFTLEARLSMIKEVFKDQENVTVEGFNGLLVDYAREKEINAIIRGLRAVSDFENEFQMSLMNRKLSDNLETVFLMTDEKYSYLSSSSVREIASFGGDVSQFVPKNVEEKMKKHE